MPTTIAKKSTSVKTATKTAPKAKTVAKSSTKAKTVPKIAAKPAPQPVSKSPVLENTPLTPLEAAKAKKKPKTILEGGLSYSLLTRVRNAFPKDKHASIEKGSKMLDVIDGRGTEQKISDAYVAIAKDLGGAKYLASVRSSHVKRELKAKGLI